MCPHFLEDGIEAATDGAFGVQRRKRRPSINITPLIDVVFLLLIFFMVSATFREHLGIDIVLPEAGTAAEQDQTPYEIAVSEAGEFYFCRQLVDEAGLRSAMVEVLEADPGASMVLRADERADFGTVIRAIDIARELGATRLIIPTRPLDE